MRKVVFTSDKLHEKSLGLKFPLPELGDFATGFVVRYDGVPYAYINQCAHISVELDWKEGEFFDANKTHFVCATHGAMYQPNNGYCVWGPCKGKQLKSLPTVEVNGEIVITIDL